MLHLLRHHAVLVLIVVIAAQYVLPFGQRVAKVRERQLDHLERIRYVQPKVGAVPQPALTAMQSFAAELPGFRQLGILTTEPSQSVYGFTGVFVDEATRSTVAQVMFVQTTFASTPKVVFTVQTNLGDPATPRLVSVSSGQSGGLVSGERPGVSGVTVPGADLPTLLALHGRQLLARPEPRLSVNSLDQAAQVFQYVNAMQRSWWLSSGRLRRDQQGHLRFSWQQCLWWAARTGRTGKAVYAKRTMARARRVEAGLPQLPLAATAVPAGH